MKKLFPKAYFQIVLSLLTLLTLTSCKNLSTEDKIVGQDYLPIYAQLKKPFADTPPNENLYRVNSMNNYSLGSIDTTTDLQGNLFTLDKLDLDQFLRYQNRKLIVETEVFDVTGWDRKVYNSIQKIEKKYSIKDLHLDDAKYTGDPNYFGDFDLNNPKINRNNTTTQIAFKISIKDPLVSKLNTKGVLANAAIFQVETSPINLTELLVRGETFITQRDYTLQWNPLVIFTKANQGFNLNSKNYYELLLNTVSFGARKAVSEANIKIPRFLINVFDSQFFIYPPLVVYSETFPKEESNPNKAIDRFFKELGNDFL